MKIQINKFEFAQKQAQAKSKRAEARLNGDWLWVGGRLIRTATERRYADRPSYRLQVESRQLEERIAAIMAEVDAHEVVEALGIW